MGKGYENTTSDRQRAMMGIMDTLVDKLKSHLDAHAAMDSMATDFVAQRLAPLKGM